MKLRETLSERYYRRNVLSVRIDRHRALVWFTERGGGAEIAALALGLLEACVDGRTLDEQADSILKSGRFGQGLPREAIIRALTELASAGLLISDRTLVASLVDSASSVARRAQRLADSGILTCNRPEAVSRCVTSLLANLGAHQRNGVCTVVDSSPDPVMAANTRRVLDRISQTGVAIAYAGIAEKRAFAEALAREAGVDPTLTRFALLDDEGMGKDTGTNRNALLLAHAGTRFLSVDDDVVCDIRYASDQERQNLKLTGGDPVRTALFANFEQAKDSTREESACIFDIHERLVGKMVGTCIGEALPANTHIDQLSPDVITTLLTGQAHVGATFTGILGDSGSASPAFYLYSNSVDPARLPAEESAYRDLASTRQVLRATPVPAITSDCSVMTTSFALDASTLTPPFFPVFRGQDLLFGAMVRWCFDDCFFGYVPAALAHLPIDSRSVDPARLWWFTARGALSGIIMNALGIASVGVDVAPKGGARLKLLGRRLAELASRSWPEFRELVRAQQWRSAARGATNLEFLARAVDASHPWARDARAFARARLTALGEPDNLEPLAVEQDRSVERSRERLQKLLRRYGALLEAWPEIFDAAKRLRQEGKTLATALRERRC